MKYFLFELHPSFLSYTCVINGAAVGWTALTRHHVNDGLKHTAEMSLYVQEPFRRKGIGSALANVLLSRANAANLHCILAMIFKDMPGVVSFAERQCAFSLAGCLPEAFHDLGKNYDILVLQKLVSP